jgi:hypothetical protein
MGSEGKTCKGKEYKGKSFKINASKGKALENNAYIDTAGRCSTSKGKACYGTVCKVMLGHVSKRWCVMAMDVRGMHVCADMSGQGIIGKCTLEDNE